jgi:hypothetical protein
VKLLGWLACCGAAALASAGAEVWTSSGLRELGTLPTEAQWVREEFRQGDRLVRLEGVLFHSSRTTLKVIAPPAPEVDDFPQVLQEAGCFAGTNGGYFHPDYRPLGLVLSAGVERHPRERARLLSGFLGAGENGIDLWRWAETAPPGVQDALQAGPFLVDGGEPVTGLEATRSARRTIIATDGQRRWFLGIMSHCTLAEAGFILTHSQLFPAPGIRRALNLDGGSSTGLWVEATPEGASGTLQRPRVAVSNFVGLAPR